MATNIPAMAEGTLVMHNDNKKTKPIHVVSWNVAGWKKTLSAIIAAHGSLQEWLDKHCIDILAIQEAKTTTNNLKNDGPSYWPPKMSTGSSSFEAYWCSCDKNMKGVNGMNGVATFVRHGVAGTSVIKANPAPFDENELNEEGRCLVTDHGPYVICNVYVPNAGGGPHRLIYKMKFLRKLRKIMQEHRDAGKNVILLGDLNLTYRACDVPYSWRRMNLYKFMDDGLSSEPNRLIDRSPELRRIQDAFAAVAHDVLERITGRVVKPRNVTNAKKQTVVKYRVWLNALKSNSDETIGDLHDTDADAFDSLDFSSRGAFDEAKEAFVARRFEGDTYVGCVSELITKVAEIPCDISSVAKLLGTSSYARSPHGPAVADWMQAIIEEDGMVDSFVQHHPSARDRYTCWEQYRNRRYENEGSRIDYILIDKGFFHDTGSGGRIIPLQGNVEDLHLQQGNAQKASSSTSCDVSSKQAARAACTANGGWAPASFEGGGLSDGSSRAYKHQFYKPHTGIVYTPPKFSDHVGVSTVLEIPMGLVQRYQTTKSTDKSTRKAQPHKATPSVASFFQPKKPSAPGLSPTPSLAQTHAIAPQKKAPLCPVCLFRQCVCKPPKKRKTSKAGSGGKQATGKPAKIVKAGLGAYFRPK